MNRSFGSWLVAYKAKCIFETLSVKMASRHPIGL